MPSRLPDGANEQGDDVGPIETSRPDTRKVEGEEPDNRHRASYAPGPPIGSPGPSSPFSRSPHEEGSRVLRVHLRKGRLPPAGHLNLRIEPRQGDFLGHLTREHARLYAIIARYAIIDRSCTEGFDACQVCSKRGQKFPIREIEKSSRKFEHIERDLFDHPDVLIVCLNYYIPRIVRANS